MKPDLSSPDLARETFATVLTSTLALEGARGHTIKAMMDLDWGRVQEELARRCAGDDAAAIAREFGLLPTGPVLRRRGAEVEELRVVTVREESPPFAGIRSVGRVVLRARKGDVLRGEELLAVADTIGTTARIRSWFLRRADRMPLLSQHAQNLRDHDELAVRIRRSFDPSGELSDNASPDLGRLRRRVLSLRTDIVTRIERIIRAPRYEGILQDDFFTIRDERYVVPVRAGEKGDVPGIVHGHSSSGATLFIEPQELIGPNNEFRMAQLDVENEVRRILGALSEAVAAVSESLETNQDILTYLDLTAAGARIAVDLEGAVLAPPDDASPRIALHAARHPVLAFRELAGELRVVPNDVVLDPAHRVLVISGPNTGGKTVTLKTVGLVALLVRAGLPVPTEPESVFPVFDQVFPDIGDDQGVERDLSTFSGHVANIAKFLPKCGPGTLVLLDELFAGTDPEQGAALGRALLQRLVERGAWVVVTTHLESLKTLAWEDDRYACASVGFDVERLAPNYRLRPGVPGSSYAFRIAARLGLEAAVIGRAEASLGAGPSVQREALIGRMEAELQRLGDEREAAAAARRAAESEHAAVRELRARAEKRAEEAIAEDLRRTRAELAEAQKQLKTVRALLVEVERDARERRDPEAGRTLEQAHEIARRVEERARALERERAERSGGSRRPLNPSELTPGRPVWVGSVGQRGTIAGPPGPSGRVPVQLGPLRAVFEAGDLHDPEGVPAAVANPALRRAPPRPPGARVEDDPAVSGTLDLRGVQADEAIDQLDAFLDRAWRARLYQMTIIHGHGTGVLRRAVRARIPKLPYPMEFRAGERNEGGDGVTIVTFRNEATPGPSA